ncbi:hypothetical protein Tdes44962_MAKER08245 [Teratosphaeria destructans]|uniref:Uncharacterized protein n=1 Tax=Teratosphaeria destructans TaxID=418781 RepID=A0A9W7SX30_9PEZI|nr:hypothetical protein Tdes44962_MAKER08245 [Teratosphaeria destructans]
MATDDATVYLAIILTALITLLGSIAFTLYCLSSLQSTTFRLEATLRSLDQRVAECNRSIDALDPHIEETVAQIRNIKSWMDEEGPQKAMREIKNSLKEMWDTLGLVNRHIKWLDRKLELSLVQTGNRDVRGLDFPKARIN